MTERRTQLRSVTPQRRDLLEERAGQHGAERGQRPGGVEQRGQRGVEVLGNVGCGARRERAQLIDGVGDVSHHGLARTESSARDRSEAAWRQLSARARAHVPTSGRA